MKRSLTPFFSFLFGGFLFLSCQNEEPEQKAEPKDNTLGEGSLESRPLPETKPSPGNTLFTSLSPSESGVDFTHELDLSHPLKRLYHGGFATGGTTLGDLDGDGLPEIFIASGPGKNRLFRNLGGLKFSAVDNDTLSGGDAWGTGATLADIDNDGDLDIYLCNYQSPNQLFINEGDLRFTEQAAEYGLDFSDGSLMPSFCDYDNDGDLDCFVLTYRLYREGGWPMEPRYEVINGTPRIKDQYQDYYRVAQSGETNGKPQLSVKYAGRRDLLFRNEGTGKFKDVSRSAGIVERGHGLSATWWDANNDGLMDLYVGNDFDEPDRFYLNQGDGTFRDVIRESVPHTTWFSMGADAADLNNDGLLDFLIADMSSRTHFDQKVNMGAMGDSRWFLENANPRQYMRNALYLNSGTMRFNEAAYLAGLADTDWTWAVKLADFDNDGWNDAFFTNGAARNFTDSDRTTGNLRGRTQWEAFEDNPKREEQNLAFKNQGQLDFTDVSAEWGLAHKGVSYAAASADLDADGDLDLVVSHLDEPVAIYRNNSTTQGTTIHLRGVKSNHYGYGARIKVETSSGIQIRELAPSSGFLSCDEPILHFGTKTEEITKLTIRWPGGHVQQFTDLPAGHRHLITEGSQSLDPIPTLLPTFVEDDNPPGFFRHQETNFDDFLIQPLLANKLSQLGPGIASSGELLWFGGAQG